MSACGYDSVPWDLGAMLAVQQLKKGGAVRGSMRVEGFVGTSAGGVSGGTIASLLHALVEDPRARAMQGGHTLDPEWAPRPDAGPQMLPKYSPVAQRWTLPSIMAAVNEKVVNRSAALAPELYGERGAFSYTESTLAPNAVGAAIGTALMGVGALALALPPSRWLLNKVRLMTWHDAFAMQMLTWQVLHVHRRCCRSPGMALRPRRARAASSRATSWRRRRRHQGTHQPRRCGARTHALP